MGPHIGQMGLLFANDMGSVMMEENVVFQPRARPTVSTKPCQPPGSATRVSRPRKRDNRYDIIRAHFASPDAPDLSPSPIGPQAPRAKLPPHRVRCRTQAHRTDHQPLGATR
ncbi:MAG: hypothetical protein R3B46_00485 [Phycisphaerales bacterium]